ncbi:UvrD-helicase domain-containing protein [Actinoplanes sp. Pm04-4]|uniref:DNA 3'-5' helicase n=1 Tax=Paractinoplanes pyxinae TaxID=2997416 RepID=A0ABT4B4B4_9ACTN|nr:UvrD-helicase domain-containing protein [Actinoplanes pyxinae]MCY1141352.1 UvrD-helicase domain-containing protein [Actinoplanes pyxinae]
MSHAPTAEQAAIIDAAAPGDRDLTIEAGAGAGKTSTLKMLAAAKPGQRGVYLAYNKAIAVEAAKSFPGSVTCKTAHSFAYGAVGKRFAHRLNGPRVPARQAAQIMRINEPIKIGETFLAPQQLARLVTETIQRFCYSAEDQVDYRHVPLVNGLDRFGQAELRTYLQPLAQKAWDVDITRETGRLRFTHDCYLKMWILSGPQLHADYVLLDEAQDSNPAVAGLVDAQDAQRILVGDRSQAIYGWRGATDAMATFGGERYTLSQSFRFGPAVAAEANKWLSLLDAPLRLRGFDPIKSRLEPLAGPDAILCRSNAGAIGRVMAAIGSGQRAALVGGGGDIRRMAEAAQQLQHGLPTDHPELFAFGSWREVQDYVEQDAGGSDLKVFVKLVDQHGPAELIRVCDALVDERYADVVVSTAHKAKGREWQRVAIATDFQEPRPGEDGETRIPREDAMLAYVAVTRAQLVLDREGLAWVDHYVDGAPATMPADSWIGAAVLEHPEAVLPDGPELLTGPGPLPAVGGPRFAPAPRKPRCTGDECGHLEVVHRAGPKGRGQCASVGCRCQAYAAPELVEAAR